MSVVEAKRCNDLKSLVKQECLKRIYISDTPNSKSVGDYGGDSYDYSTPPEKNSVIEKEHREKIVVPLNAINDKYKLTKDQPVLDEEDFAALEAFIIDCQKQKKVDKDAANNACAGGCTGYCYTTCTGECSNVCSGCTNLCTGCGGVCSSSCDGGDCLEDCSSTACKGGCIGSTCSSGSTSTGSCRACDGEGCEPSCKSNGCYGQACLIHCDRGNCRGSATDEEFNPDTGGPAP